jgi:hypothetical protein
MAGSPRSRSIVSTVSIPRPEKVTGRRTARQATARRTERRPRAETTARGSQPETRVAVAGSTSTCGEDEMTTRAVPPLRRAVT